ncbi:hypothetical protein ACIQW5_27695 [Methylorubrum thiocyanatum]|uniref:hypothetical protein n=1 Tax=Methylorubrum thiocyanatum TaxID=47958 RepID=UPI00383A858F
MQYSFGLSQVSVDTAIAIGPRFIIAVAPILGRKSAHLYGMSINHFFYSELFDYAELRGVSFAFFDGMHLFEFLSRDLSNNKEICNLNGLMALHDRSTLDGEMIERVNNTEGRSENSKHKLAWTGDICKGVSMLQKYRPLLRAVLVNCEPAGLKFVANLDPTSRVLKYNFLNIVKEFNNIPKNPASLDAFFDSLHIVEANSMIKNFDHALRFKL